MRAVVFRKSLPITDPESLVDVELPRPEPAGRDLLVKVEAVSVNPVDTKRRRGGDPPGGMRVLGWDAAGTVEAAGTQATLFKRGDAVFYAGSVIRPGAPAHSKTTSGAPPSASAARAARSSPCGRKTPARAFLFTRRIEYRVVS